ncbi:MAG: hypothetical protein J6P47_03905 [Acetobacter sp.]|nr:hypothetical protein [Acetobacter sp.]
MPTKSFFWQQKRLRACHTKPTIQSKNMTNKLPPHFASIFSFPKRGKLTPEQAQDLRDHLDEYRGRIPEDIFREILKKIEENTASQNLWEFIMSNPKLNYYVIDYMLTHSKRPNLAVRFWSLCWCYLRIDTGEIMLTRQEIADKLGILSCNVSRVISEFEKIGAIIRERKNGRAYYFVNAWVATHLTGEARDKAQNEAPLLPLIQETDKENSSKQARLKVLSSGKNKKEASDEVVPETDLTHEVSTSMREAVPTKEASKPKKGKRWLKVLNGEKTFKAFCWVGLFTSSFDCLNCLHAYGIF